MIDGALEKAVNASTVDERIHRLGELRRGNLAAGRREGLEARTVGRVDASLGSGVQLLEERRRSADLRQVTVGLRMRQVQGVAELVGKDAGDEIALGIPGRHGPAVHDDLGLDDFVAHGEFGEGDAQHAFSRHAEEFFHDAAVGVVEHPETVALFDTDEIGDVFAGHVGDAGPAFDRAGDRGLERRGLDAAPLIQRALGQFIGPLDREKGRDAVEVESEGLAAVGVDGNGAVIGVPAQRRRVFPG